MIHNSIDGICAHLDSLGTGHLLFQDGRLTFINAYGKRLLPGLEPGLPLPDFLPEDYTLSPDEIILMPITICGKALDAKLTITEDYVLAELAETQKALSDSTMRAISDSLMAPITTIRVLTPKLLPQLAETEDPQTLERTAMLNKSLYSLYRAVNNIRLSVSPVHTTDLSIKHINASLWLSELAEQLQSVCEYAQRRFSFSLPPRDYFCQIDQSQMERAIYNLVSNAIKYTEPQGTIELSVTKTSGSRLRISIRDNGCGIPAYKMCNLFQMKAHRGELPDPREGIGLGLPLAKSILTAHEGTLLLESREKIGTTVHLFLPISPKSDSYPLHSNVLRPDYSGSFSPILLELSDVLPASAFDTRGVDL